MRSVMMQRIAVSNTHLEESCLNKHNSDQPSSLSSVLERRIYGSVVAGNSYPYSYLN